MNSNKTLLNNMIKDCQRVQFVSSNGSIMYDISAKKLELLINSEIN